MGGKECKLIINNYWVKILQTFIYIMELTFILVAL